jgi:hypothetical protein
LLLQVQDTADSSQPISRFAIGLTQKLCYFANSTGCLESDPESIAFLKNLSRATPVPEDPLRWIPSRAAEMLERLAILDAPDWRRQITGLLKRELDFDSYNNWGCWAETVAEKRCPEELLAHSWKYIESIRKQLSPSWDQLLGLGVKACSAAGHEPFLRYSESCSSEAM